MNKGGIYSVFRTNDRRSITLRPLRRSDLDALAPFANSFVRERKRNRELGITSMERRMTRADEKTFLDKTLLGVAKMRQCRRKLSTNRERLWASRYGRPLADIFTIQDEIAGQIATFVSSFLTGRGARVLLLRNCAGIVHESWLKSLVRAQSMV